MLFLPEQKMSERPDRMIVILDEELGVEATQTMAQTAVDIAKQRLPKITGGLAGSLLPVFGENFFGIHSPNRISWFLERGTNPFTMKSLEGKVIPMWVDDPNGDVARENKKAETRITVDGRRQTLIFRRAARNGQRKKVWKNGAWTSVPRSYPGAPGRINQRGTDGRIAQGNVGVRWRHPGIQARFYLNGSISETVEMFGLQVDWVYLIDAATYPTATKS